MRTRMYIGHASGRLIAFDSVTPPTQSSHGHLYGAVIGPFRTRRAQLWAEKHGAQNPHFRCVNDAERIAHSDARQRKLKEE